MATAQTIIQNARYDLGDFGGQKYNDTMLLHYLNRMIPIFDSVLVALNSDFLKTSASVSLASGSNVAALPTRCDKVSQVWLDTDLWLKEPLDLVMYRYQINNSTGSSARPSYWAYNADNLFFNVDSDDDYTLTVYFMQRTATLALTDDMPYNSLFDEFFREAIVTMAHKAVDNKVPGVDGQFYASFKAMAERHVISRNMKYKNFYIDF